MGPVATVLLPNALRQSDLTGFHTVLNRISSHVEESHLYYREFWVIDTAPIGGDFEGTDCTIGVAMKTPELEPEELEVVQQQFGFTPMQGLQFDAMCNSRNDHRILALLTLYFAEAYGGIVQLGCSLSTLSVSFADAAFLRGWLRDPGFHMCK